MSPTPTREVWLVFSTARLAPGGESKTTCDSRPTGALSCRKSSPICAGDASASMGIQLTLKSLLAPGAVSNVRCPGASAKAGRLTV